MGGGACVVIIEGGGVQGASALLSTTAATSCQLVDYLINDDDVTFNPADMQPVIDFHLRAEKKLKEMNAELDKANRELAAKYNR